MTRLTHFGSGVCIAVVDNVDFVGRDASLALKSVFNKARAHGLTAPAREQISGGSFCRHFRMVAAVFSRTTAQVNALPAIFGQNLAIHLLIIFFNGRLRIPRVKMINSLLPHSYKCARG